MLGLSLAAALAQVSPSMAADEAVPVIVVTAPARRPYAAVRVPERELAAMRGGLRLPNGLDLSLGIDLQTRVNGLLALHTVYASDGAAAGLRVFTDGDKPVRLAPTTLTATSGTIDGTPLLVVDRSPTGPTIIPTLSIAPTTVNLVSGDPSTWLSGEGQKQVPVTPNGPAQPTPLGAVDLTSNAQGATVTLRGDGLEIQQRVGQATGVIVANTANDRSIDTITAVNVDLRGLSPGLLSSTFAAQRAALEATLTR